MSPELALLFQRGLEPLSFLRPLLASFSELRIFSPGPTRTSLHMGSVTKQLFLQGDLHCPIRRTLMDTKDFTVLLVEDDLNDIFLVKRAFKMAQLENPLQVVTDGQEATHYLSGQGKYADREAHPLPKLIVMDIKMPRMSGFEVLDRKSVV